MIRINGYSKKFGSFTAVQPLDLEIKKGEIFALLGPNGSGKTTLIKSLVGLTRPTTGSIYIDGKELISNDESILKKIAYFPQRITMPENLTPKEVLTFFAEMNGVSEDRIGMALEAVDLTYDTDRLIGELSGGMLQRLGLAIIFLGDPSVYVLDEPTLNLDRIGMRKFNEQMKLLKKEGKTIIFSSHNLLEAERLADRVGVMAEGKLVIDRSVEEFREKVKSESRILLVLTKQEPQFIDVAKGSGAELAYFENGYLAYHSAEEKQIQVMEALRNAGADILHISTQEPGIEQLIEGYFEN